MSQDILIWIQQYGLVALFIFVFLQEAGIPIPIPNELVYLFAGYLASQDRLDFVGLLVVAIAADFLGSFAMFGMFYAFGDWLLGKYPNLVSPTSVKNWRAKLSTKDGLSIYFGRLIPYARAVVSVAAGSLRVSPAVYSWAALVAAVTWSGGWVILGRLLGPAWSHFAGQWQIVNWIILAVVIVIILIFAIMRWRHTYRNPGRKS